MDAGHACGHRGWQQHGSPKKGKYSRTRLRGQLSHVGPASPRAASLAAACFRVRKDSELRSEEERAAEQIWAESESELQSGLRSSLAPSPEPTLGSSLVQLPLPRPPRHHHHHHHYHFWPKPPPPPPLSPLLRRTADCQLRTANCEMRAANPWLPSISFLPSFLPACLPACLARVQPNTRFQST